MIYLDEAASAPPKPEVLQAMWPHLTSGFANPASRHEPGLEAERALGLARKQVAAHLGARASEIIFTSGGTEANNAAIKGIALSAPRGKHILVSALEHPSVAESAAWLVGFGFRVEQIPVGASGRVSPATLAELITPETTLVSIQTASNEVGTVQDIAALSEVSAHHAVPFHTDAVQAAGAMPLDVSTLGVQALSLAGHKIGTPKGIGVLYLRRRTPFQPLIHGGGQQADRRSGTENVAGAAAMAAALDSLDTEGTDWVRRRDDFISVVEAHAPGAALTGHRRHRLPGHASFIFAGRSGESILLDLEREGISCSSGSACHAGSTEPSPSLIAMGYSADEAQSAVRFSFGPHTPAEDLDKAARAVCRAVGAD